jgi:diketogulonate reductase-like aldo/keto reductase
MSQLTFTLNDGNRIPFLAFGTGTSFGRQDVTEPASLAIEKGFTHLDCAQVRTYNHSRSVPVFMVEMSKSSLITTKTLSVPRSRHPESPENRSL